MPKLLSTESEKLFTKEDLAGAYDAHPCGAEARDAYIQSAEKRVRTFVPKFQPGDRVRLISGGPLMTCGASRVSETLTGTPEVVVVWYEKDLIGRTVDGYSSDGFNQRFIAEVFLERI